MRSPAAVILASLFLTFSISGKADLLLNPNGIANALVARPGADADMAKPAGPPGVNAALAQTERPAGMDAGLWQAFERSIYALKDSGGGIWRGQNRAQRLSLEFDSQGARLHHPDGSVNFQVTGYGYGERLRKPAPARLTGTGQRLEYLRGDLTEWYENRATGLEQSFRIARRPSGSGWDPLVLVLRVGGGLSLSQNADAVELASGKRVVLRYGGLTAVDASGRTVRSRMEVRGHEIRLIVEDRGARYPLVVDPTWSQQAELTSANGARLDYFGASVAVSGNTAVIGIADRPPYGAADVFVQNGGIWSQQAELTPSDGKGNDSFAWSVALSGDTAVIGTPVRAYVFVRNGATWSQQAEPTASDGAAIGLSVAVSGDTAVIGSPNSQAINHIQQGAAYVFVRNGTSWTQQAKLTVPNEGDYDHFGWWVAVSGATAVIGSPGNSSAGAAYVFVQNGATWSLQQKLTAPDEGLGDDFGWRVSVSGGTALIGAFAHAIGANSEQGAAYVFVQNGATWSQQAELTASDGAAYDNFGASVSVSGGTALITSPGHAGNGAAYVFVQNGATWSLQAELTASDGATNDAFGYAAALSGATAVVGAYHHQVGGNIVQGAAYAFAGPEPLLIAVTGGNNQSASLNTPFAEPLQVLVEDASTQNPVSGVTVNFSAPGSGASATLSTPALTDSNGLTSVTATANSVAGGPYTVTAWATGATPVSFSLTNTAIPAAIIATAGTPQSAKISTPFATALQVKVTDVNNNPLSGVTVTFKAPASGASATLSTPAVTNAGGLTRVTATANNITGFYQVTASVNGVATGAVFNLFNNPVPTPPTAVSVAGMAGDSLSQTLTFTYSSVNGWQWINDAYALINTNFTHVRSCYVLYQPGSNSLYLQPDGSGNTTTGPLTPGSAGALSNNQCTVHGSGSSAVRSGNTVQLTLSLTLTPSFGGAQNIYMYVNDGSGLNSGWKTVGTTAVATAPTVGPVTGITAGSLSQTLTFNYSSVNGYSWINGAYALVNSIITGTRACYVYYVPFSNALYLQPDGATDTEGPLTPGSSMTIGNAECTLNGGGSSVRGSGNTLTLTLSLTFTSNFGSGHFVYLYANDKGGLNSGWQQRGSTAVATAPAVGSVTGTASGTLGQTLTFTYSSVNGYRWLNGAYALVNKTLSATKGCEVYYLPTSNALYLQSDGTTAQQGPLTPGSAKTIGNAECTLNGTGSSVSGSGITLTLTLSLTFAGSVPAAENIYACATDYAGLNSGWQNLSALTLP